MFKLIIVILIIICLILIFIQPIETYKNINKISKGDKNELNYEKNIKMIHMFHRGIIHSRITSEIIGMMDRYISAMNVITRMKKRARCAEIAAIV